MRKHIVAIITTLVIVLTGWLSFLSTEPSYAFGQEQIWNYFNNQLYGGAIQQLVVLEGLDEKWFCTVNRNSLYLKNGSNDYWEPIPLPQENTYIQYIFPYQTFLILVADQGMYLYQGEYQGESIWEPLNSPKDEKTIKIIKITDQLQNYYWMATTHGLYYSLDQAVEDPEALFTWHISNFNAIYEIKDIWYDDFNKTLFVLTSDGWIFFSKEPNSLHFNEMKWDKMKLADPIHHVQQIITAQDNQKTWLISTQSQGVFISRNNGNTWENISRELPNLYISQMMLLDQDVYISTYGGLFVYHLEQNKWDKLGESLFNDQINCFGIDLSTNKIRIGTNGNGVWLASHTSSGLIWNKDDQKIEGILVKKMIKNHLENKILLATWGAGAYVSNDNGIHWKQSNQGLTNPYLLSMFYESDDQIWAGTYNGGLFFTNDFGENWILVKSSTLLSKYIYSILVDRNNTDVLYVGTDRNVFKTINHGQSWNKLELGTEDQPVGNIITLEQDTKNPDTIYAGTNLTGAYISKDAGQSWYPTKEGLSFPNIQQIKAIPHTNPILIAATNGDGCYISRNQGQSWEKMEDTVKNRIVYDIAYSVDKNWKEECLISTENGIYRYHLTNKNWQPIGNNVSQTSIRAALYYQKQWWIGTYGKGVARLVDLPEPPIPMDPPNQAETTKTRIMFRWSESSYSEYPVLYKVQISTKKDFSENTYLSNTISGDQWLIPDNILQKHKTYYWRVRGETILGETAWSKIYQFTIVTIIQMQINQSQIQINGQSQPLDKNPDVVPILREGRTFLPIRIIVESWEGTIGWENATKKVIIQVGEHTVYMIIGQSIAYVDNVPTKIDSNNHVVPFIYNGRTMLPLRFIAESLKAQVEWDAETQRVTLLYPLRR